MMLPVGNIRLGLLLLLSSGAAAGCLQPRPDGPADGAAARPFADGGGGADHRTADGGTAAEAPDAASDGARADGSSPFTPDGRADGGGDGDPDAAGCTDPLEPNDRPEEAVLLESGRYPGLRICPGDVDRFALLLEQGERFDIRALFDARQGDIDMLLTNTVSGRQARFEATGDDEVAEGTAASTGRYLLEIYGFDGAANDYDLVIRLGDHCADDGGEPDDAAAQARPLGAGEVEGIICPGNEDWYAVSLPARRTLVATISFAAGEGDLELELLRQLPDGTRQSVASSQGQGDLEAVEAGPSEQNNLYFLRIYGYRQASAAYRLAVLLVPPGEGGEVIVEGRVSRDELPPTEDGFAAPLVVPARQVVVELVRELDQRVLGRGQTNDDGGYRISAASPLRSALYLRALARVEEGWRPLVEVVTPGRGWEEGAIHALRSPAEPWPPDGATLRLDLHVPAADGPGGAFNVVDAVLDARRFLSRWIAAGARARPWPLLQVRWEPGRSFACGSCFAGDRIELGGGLDDPDEFDDAVILHEVGHFVARHWSADDSPGGSHDRRREDPLLAWSEGWATYHSCMVRQDSRYLDYRLTDVLLDDLEHQDLPDSFGTENGRADGDISELLVSALLWDLLDGGETDDDTLAGSERMLEPVFGYLALERRGDRGVAGADLQDYLDGWLCHEVGLPEELTPLLQQREVPYDPAGAPQGCRRQDKPAAPVSALLVRLGAGEGLLEISPAIDAPAVEVQVLGRPPLQLGPLAAGQTARLAISSPSGLPLHAGVSLLLGAGRRLHAVARATDDPSTTRAGKQADEHLLQALRRAGLPALRPSRAGLHSVLDLQGRLLVQWQQPLSWGRLDRLR